MTDPITKTLTVPLAPAAAFDLFTAGMDRWWPKESHSLHGASVRIRVEPVEGGRIVEIAPDGTEAPWGRITTWEPPHRLAVAWHVGRDEAQATDLDIRFHAQGTGTRVVLTHGGFDRLEGGAALAGNYDTGWDLVLLTCYGTAAA